MTPDYILSRFSSRQIFPRAAERLLYLHCLFLTIVASSRSATHVLESCIDFYFSAASDSANQSNCSKALIHDISFPGEGKATAGEGMSLTIPFLFLLDIADEPKTTPCTFYSLFGLPRVVALKLDSSSAGAAFDVCTFSKNV